ncbi:hypothetical protein B0T22DRAFT_427408 [Podospora appendiculata]|uniref:Uncharacterized protein n=1 Tax=Podospora appendiculata TaxID=314037 RepID=A0AAE0XBI9_9PEZI|nr:hypothetical protein B0T22DRAFT_427408 [Podospora appendiculata]
MHHPAPLLLLLLLLLLTLTTRTAAQSFVGGDLSTQAPFNLAPATFTAATANATSNATFAITGYNTSLPVGPVDGTGTALPGWSLSISVAADVPLSSSGNTSIDKTRFTEATTLSLVPPDGDRAQTSYNTSSWRVCAIVFTGGLDDAATDAAADLDGGCGALLPDDCIQQLQVNSVAANTSRNGECEDLQVPDICGGYFGDGAVGSAYADADDASQNEDGSTPFFAAGSAPTGRGNASALAAAERTVWPVLLTWTHFGANGQVHDSAGWLSCVRTPNTTTGALESSGSAFGKGGLWWALLAGLAVAGWGACGLDW